MSSQSGRFFVIVVVAQQPHEALIIFGIQNRPPLNAAAIEMEAFIRRKGTFLHDTNDYTPRFYKVKRKLCAVEGWSLCG